VGSLVIANLTSYPGYLAAAELVHDAFADLVGLR